MTSDRDILAFFHAEESRRVRKGDKCAVNDAIDATAAHFKLRREDVRDLVWRDGCAGMVG